MTYPMTIAGIKRELPLCKVADDFYIGAFIMFGDAEITVACAKELLARAPTQHDQDLYLSGEEAAKMKGKKILIVDDVISTGESLHALEELVHQAGGEVAGRMAVLAEGDAQKREDIVYLEKLPVFNADGTVKE